MLIRRQTLNSQRTTDESVPLLEAGADEEARQSERVREAEQAVIDGAAVRLDSDRIEEIALQHSQASLTDDDAIRQIEEINKRSLMDEEKKLIEFKEKARILAEQAEQNARRKRQAEAEAAKAA